MIALLRIRLPSLVLLTHLGLDNHKGSELISFSFYPDLPPDLISNLLCVRLAPQVMPPAPQNMLVIEHRYLRQQ